MKTLTTILNLLWGTAFAHSASVPSPLFFNVNNFSSTAYPFFATTNVGPSVRYQQVYSASDFVFFGSPQYLITGMSFGAGSGGGPIEVTIPNLQISFSTTPKVPDGLSGIFSENVGGDDTVVFSGPLHVVYTGFEWNMGISFQQPFLFDPQAGNLLMDVRNFQTIPPLQGPPPGIRWVGLSVFETGDTTSRMFALDVSSPTASFVSTEGLLTLFTVTPVPEPSSVSLLALGLCGLVWVAWRRKYGFKKG